MSNYDNDMWNDIASSADPPPLTDAQRRQMERSRNPNIDPDEQDRSADIWA